MRTALLVLAALSVGTPAMAQTYDSGFYYTGGSGYYGGSGFYYSGGSGGFYGGTGSGTYTTPTTPTGGNNDGGNNNGGNGGNNNNANGDANNGTANAGAANGGVNNDVDTAIDTGSKGVGVGCDSVASSGGALGLLAFGLLGFRRRS